MGMIVNDKVYRKKVKKLQRFALGRLPKIALQKFKDETPIDKGRARRQTKLKKKAKGFTITGDYNYSGVIDRGEYPKNPVNKTGKTQGGYSTQSPKGMTGPTSDFVNKEVRDFIRRI